MLCSGAEVRFNLTAIKHPINHPEYHAAESWLTQDGVFLIFTL